MTSLRDAVVTLPGLLPMAACLVVCGLSVMCGGDDFAPSASSDALGEVGPADVTPDEVGPGDVAGEAPDVGPRPEPLPVFGVMAARRESSVLPEGLESCPVYRETACDQGVLRQCEIYDAASGAWAETPDPWVEQVFWYDRYYDLYHRMEGQQAEFLYRQPMPPGTPEAVWGAAESFQRYSGYWDAAGWTGTALQAAAARYLSTGTEADYERMLDQLEAMMFMYEATDVPGLLMRCHFAMLEEGAPDPVGHPGKALVHYAPPEVWQDRYVLAPDYAARVPSYYTEGVTIQGVPYGTTPRWMGDASRDMYVRSLPGVLLAFDLLGAGEREARLRGVIAEEIPCTLKRMKKLRIRNLKQSELFKDALAAYLGSDHLRRDPGDIDLTAIDSIVGYVMEQPRPDQWEHFDAACPDLLPMDVDPEYDLDAADSGAFLLRFMEIAARLRHQGDVPIAWVQFPSVRGSDTLFMTQWALAGHYLTGDERFLDFLAGLMEEVEYWPVVHTMGSFWMPKWCRSYYGPSLLYPTFWNLQNRIDRETHPEFWSNLALAIKEEFRGKELVDANDAYFGVLYDTMVSPEIDPEAAAFVELMVDLLRQTRQHPSEDPFEPRRSYNVDLLSEPPPGFSAEIEEMPQEQYDLCMKPIEIFGVKIDGYVHDELPRAAQGLAIRYRIAGPFQWQEDPFLLFKDYGDLHARIQWPMSGFSVAYWTGRMQGTITEGLGHALAWRDTGEACE